jgi:hypothetical protein
MPVGKDRRWPNLRTGCKTERGTTMRIESNRAWTRYRAFVAALLAACLAGCAAGPTGQPLRTYGNLEGKDLRPFVTGVFKEAGYTTSECHRARICYETSWKESDGAVRGGVRWRERRMYVVWLPIGALQDQYDLYLELVVEERPSAAAEWIDKPVVAREDPEYVRIVQALDRVVKELGGVQVLARRPQAPEFFTASGAARRMA